MWFGWWWRWSSLEVALVVALEVTVVVCDEVTVVVALVVCDVVLLDVTVVLGVVVTLVVGVVISHVSSSPATYILIAALSEAELESHSVLSIKNFVNAHEMVSLRPSTGPVTSLIMLLNAVAVSSQLLP